MQNIYIIIPITSVGNENNGQLKSLLEKDGALIQFISDEELYVYKLDMKRIGITAKNNNLAIYKLTKVQPSLEELFIELILYCLHQ